MDVRSPRMSSVFAVTWDYRCPFARNAHEHILTGLAAGADWDVRYLAFSLGQVHVEEGEPDIWDRWEEGSGVLALQGGAGGCRRARRFPRAVPRGPSRSLRGPPRRGPAPERPRGRGAHPERARRPG